MDTEPAAAATRDEHRGSSPRIEILADDLAALNLPEVLDLAALDQLESIVDEISGERELRGLLLRGSRSRVFCEGIDLDCLAGLNSAGERRRFIQRGQKLLKRIAHLSLPTVALIRGPCLGAGLELALACDARVAVPDPRTRLGLPQVTLGIIPAWGGCALLPRLIGPGAARDLATTGRQLAARAALASGLVDRVAPPEHLELEGRDLADELRRGTFRRRRPRRLGTTRPGTRGLPARRGVTAGVRRALRRDARGPTPAQQAVTRVLAAAAESTEPALAQELEEAGTLLGSEAHGNLLRLARLIRTGRRPELYRLSGAARPVREAAVIGTGTMGGGIAALLVGRGIAVRLIDPDPAALVRAARRIEETLDWRERKGALDAGERRRLQAQVTASREIDGLAGVDLIIECVPERRELKEQVLGRVDALARRDAVVGIATASLGIDGLAASIRAPERVLGLNFCNPPERVRLVEIVRGVATDAATLGIGLRLAEDLEKVPVVVGDGPGFLVNRLLAPCFLEACRIAQEGRSITAVDEAVREFGFPTGPFGLMDDIGVDVVIDAVRHMARGDDDAGPHPLIEGLAAQGRLGRKSGEGFYRYGRGRPTVGPTFLRMARDFARPGQDPALRGPGLAQRIVGRMAAEARKVLGEGRVSSPDDVDIASVYGIGYPGWRGGLLHDVRTAERQRRPSEPRP